MSHTPEQLYALVLDVQKYPQFLPWCLAARVKSQTESELTADLSIGFNMFRETFTSYVAFDSDKREIVLRSA